MHTHRPQRTIANTCQVSGRGYWSGQQVCVQFAPASEGSGIRFVRTDLPGSASVPALVQNRQSISLRTVLVGEDQATFSMVEHVLAALSALEIDNVNVLVDAQEMPGLDGSSAPFVAALKSVGAIDQPQPIHPLVVDRVMRIGNAGNWIEASPSESGRLEVEYQLDYGEHCPIPAQSAHCVITPESFADQLATARTFVTAQQVEQLQAKGVGQHVTSDDLLIFDHQGLVAGELLFPNECARHKALDMVGDLSLTGFPLIGKFVSHRGGHELNAAMAERLQKLSNRTHNQFRKSA